jgi:hypothetical protein
MAPDSFALAKKPVTIGTIFSGIDPKVALTSLYVSF